VLLAFGEAPDPSLSLVRIVDENGAAVSGGATAHAGAGDEKQLELDLARALPRGVYTVNWLVVSAEDGHVESGAFAFGVGERPALGSEVVVPLGHSSTWTDTLGAIGRWLL
jgi:methionine-rich copper-binding protein CopC